MHSQMRVSPFLMDECSNSNRTSKLSVCICPYQQRTVVGWPHSCVLRRGLLLTEDTPGILFIAIGLARGGNGWNV